MLKNQFETFTDRHEAIALFDHLRGRDPEKPWPLLPILAFIAPGGSGKSTLIEYLRQKISLIRRAYCSALCLFGLYPPSYSNRSPPHPREPA